MIDPTDPKDIIYYNRTKEQLEEFILFCISVAGKNAITTSRGLDKFLQPAREYNLSPFDHLRLLSFDELTANLKNSGFGCYNNRAKSFTSLINAHLDLKNCSVVDLEQIHGIGPKTSRFFVLFSRPDAKVAVLDTHLLSWLREKGYDVPKATPCGKKYLEIEQIFLNEAEKQDRPIVEFDLSIWNEKRQNERI
jgi:thermostable 8-oxoguanine DNA glycosylase